MISSNAGSCARISLPGTAVALVIATDEELEIASDAGKLAR
jgi:acetate kinase